MQASEFTESVDHHANQPHSKRAISQPKQRQHHHQHLHGPRTPGMPATAGPVRKRISRACDQCNQLRTKCDGQHPCSHCTEIGIACEYLRQKKKRGKASRKDLEQQATIEGEAIASSSNSQNGGESGSPIEKGPYGQITKEEPGSLNNPDINQKLSSQQNQDYPKASIRNHHSIEGLLQRAGSDTSFHDSRSTTDRHSLDHIMDVDIDTSATTSQRYDSRDPEGPNYHGQAYTSGPQETLQTYPDFRGANQGPAPSSFAHSQGFGTGNSPLEHAVGSGVGSGWGVSIPSPSDRFRPAAQYRYNHANIKYPVLVPLLPHLNNIISIGLACDLIDVYFASSSSAHMHPMSPYLLGVLFRKESFRHPTKPRPCQPALLASMLWVAAQTSDASVLSSAPSARAKTCQKLLELTVSLLKPLIHVNPGDVSAGSSPAADGVALGGLGVALPGTVSMDNLTGESGPFGAAGTLDDVITYIHLATVVSASEYKGASLRWWNCAWSLARQPQLGRELPPTPSDLYEGGHLSEGSSNLHDGHRDSSGHITEEEREERRRTWWLVYSVDRHLALCYNRPLFLLDVECSNLLQPLDEKKWQAGDFSSQPSYKSDGIHLHQSLGTSTVDGRARGPRFECYGHNIFGYFLPLMTILGEIVDLHHLRSHPRFGVGFRPPHDWEGQIAEITHHLDVYQQSLANFEQINLAAAENQAGQAGSGENQAIPDASQVSLLFPTLTSKSRRMTESEIQTRIVIAYGTHVMHVLHILLAGKWDPINLLDDNDLWISTEGFVTATSHAVAAAEAINQILEFDPGLEFMPFFFGIYLLQGSFLLLLIADKLQSEASLSVVKACETIVRAHEACVVTLSTEYQRKFSRVMRSALAQVRGRVPEDLGEQHQRRRELLALYRWTGDGTGLAL